MVVGYRAFHAHIPTSCTVVLRSTTDPPGQRTQHHLDAILDLEGRYQETPDAHDTWTLATFGSYEESEHTPLHDAFVMLTARFGLALYVGLNNVLYREGIPLLAHATEFLTNRRQTVYSLA